jgi:hypothetical protein
VLFDVESRLYTCIKYLILKLPPFEGFFPDSDVCFYIAADENYFNQHAKPLIRSIRNYFTYPIHFHLYNPSTTSKNWCLDHKISFSHEIVDIKIVDPAFEIYRNLPNDLELRRRRSKMIKPGENVERIRNELIKTYYACTRFIRLSELLIKPTYVIMLDTDSLIRNHFDLLSKDYDIHIYEKTHKKHVDHMQHLASTIFYTGTQGSFDLIQDHASLIRKEYDEDTLYWFLDQETLDIAIQKYSKNPLALSFVDFDMKDASNIWCAKGPRKNSPVWLEEIKKYL